MHGRKSMQSYEVNAQSKKEMRRQKANLPPWSVILFDITWAPTEQI